MIQSMLDLLSTWPGSLWLQRSGTAYLVINATHILGLSLMIGAIFPLDFFLVRYVHGSGLPLLARVLPQAAAFGLGATVITGLWLFSVRPHEYITNPAFLWKMLLLLLALGNICWQHRSVSWLRIEKGEPPTVIIRLRAGASIALWTSVLLAGRWIGFL